MTTGHWMHVILDPVVYSQHGTYRIARIPGGLSAFTAAFNDPRLQGTFDRTRNFRPHSIENGAVPEQQQPSYRYQVGQDGRLLLPHETDPSARTFVFGFWSLLTETTSGLRGEIDTRPVPNDAGVTRARAFFVWNFGSGPGEHAVYLDAFNQTDGVFIPHDFVDVNPDFDGLPRTNEANNGRFSTAGIESTTIAARHFIRNSSSGTRLYEFSHWEVVYLPNAGRGPEVQDHVLSIKDGTLAVMLAIYNRISDDLESVSRPKDPREFWQNILSGQAGGPVIVIGGNFPWGGPGPIGPPPSDSHSPQLEKFSYQLEDFGARLALLEAMLNKP
jgi:hypothetical protein